jgi:hypothetical protein
VWIADVDGGPAELVYTTTMVAARARSERGTGARATRRPATDQQRPRRRRRPAPDLSAANEGHIWVAPVRDGAPTRVTHDPSRYHFLHGVSPDGKTLAFAEFATYMSFPTGTLDHPADPRGRRATGPHVELDRADRAVLAVRRSGPVGIGFIGAGTVSDT